ncbi:transcription factor E [Methanobrevibacter sp. TMH8]|uniref:transcription factor E n=1 Tax=Methanobrevibacter sp. TMH8 TaxID=2848611 RepID=UPI001CCFDEC1|nr:transcription factor E [Methanobrevibacter sp. TMH8]MBZ9570760.1 transcription factor E [Methanobrevibacter sp. TMH8]
MINDPLVQELLNDVIQDEENLPVVECLINGTNTDEEIAEKTEIKLNIVRKILYKLYDSGLASYKRSKDPETQWYTYSWKFDSNGVNNQLEEKSANMIVNLKKVLEVEENNMFFVCPDEHVRLSFDQASEIGFLCPECGNEITFQENGGIIARIKEEIANYEETYSSVSSKNAK